MKLVASKKLRIKSIFKIIFFLLFCLALIFVFTPIPEPSKDFSTVIYASDSTLLSASVASDGQWRFDGNVHLPNKYTTAVLAYEDKRYYSHFGVDAISLARAIKVNLKSNKFRQGGSTISMQLARILRNKHKRNVFQKIVEIWVASKLELYYSKNEILNLYATYAPFGSNIVGIKAACHRYFGIQPQQISWAEACLLAVLPNNPALIYPGKNQQLLLNKRNKLLKKLYELNKIDKFTYQNSCIESLPNHIKKLPNHAKHLLNRVVRENKGHQSVFTSLDYELQLKTHEIIMRHHYIHKGNNVLNGSAVILDVQSGKCLAYVGNTDLKLNEHGTDVDMNAANRSYGSLIKPFLYALALEDGLILPNMLLADIPTNINGYEPQNYFENYEGAVPANEMLSKSLNIPAVRLLQEYGLEKFHENIKKLGLLNINKPASHYGLSLILGGAESNMWQLTNLYLNVTRKAMRRKAIDAFYLNENSQKGLKNELDNQFEKLLSPISCWQTLEAITESHRPISNGEWLNLGFNEKIAWKTGTSFGGRDAWAIGCTGKYIVGVWLGNASGEGRAGLTGIGAAAPLMFDIFANLKDTTWIKKPEYHTKSINTCAKSGCMATKYCNKIEAFDLPSKSAYSKICSYHKLFHTDPSKKYLVNNQCEAIADMHDSVFFVLPAIQEFYYKQIHSDYAVLPPIKSSCKTLNLVKDEIDLIYPRSGVKIYIPKQLNGKMSKVIFKAAHRNPQNKVFWHLNESYLQTTQGFHEIGVFISKAGKYTLTLVDENEKSVSCNFHVVERE